MKKPDFETYQKHFRDFEILPKFSETHVFRGTIRHPYKWLMHFLVNNVNDKTFGNLNWPLGAFPAGEKMWIIHEHLRRHN